MLQQIVTCSAVVCAGVVLTLTGMTSTAADPNKNDQDRNNWKHSEVHSRFKKSHVRHNIHGTRFYVYRPSKPYHAKSIKYHYHKHRPFEEIDWNHLRINRPHDNGLHRGWIKGKHKGWDKH
jgi:hypothetical protein